MSKAIFIDKDGTLITDIPYNADPELVTLELGASDAIRRWKARGFLIIVISNQSGVARGYFTIQQLGNAVDKLKDLLKDSEAGLDDFYFCPHHPQGTVTRYSQECECRKPAPGLLMRAAKEWNVDLGESWMIGDILNDVEAGNRAGCRTILVNNGNETEWKITPVRTPTFMVSSLTEAATIIDQFKKEPERHA